MGFRNLEVQAVVAGKVVPLVLNQLKGDPVLHVCHLGETNADFWNDALAKASTQAASATRRGEVTAQAVRDARAKNRETVAKYAVKGLENVIDDDGNPATLADVPAVVAALPDDVFDTVLAFVSNPNHFRDRDIAGDPKVIAGK